jgi:hypothetical protein
VQIGTLRTFGCTTGLLITRAADKVVADVKIGKFTANGYGGS